MPFPTGWSAKPPSAFPLLPPSQSKAGCPWVWGFTCPSPPGCWHKHRSCQGEALAGYFISHSSICAGVVALPRLCSPAALRSWMLTARQGPLPSLSSSCSSEHVDLCNSTIHLAPNTHGGDISPFIIFGQLCHHL